jgi:cell division protein FtsB
VAVASVRSSTPTGRRSAAARRSAGARVRWDRLGRIALLCVLAALLYLYLSAGLTLFSTWREARGDSSQLTALERQHDALEAQHASLTSPGTLVQEARRLGMVRPGEQAYVITGLPPN